MHVPPFWQIYGRLATNLSYHRISSQRIHLPISQPSVNFLTQKTTECSYRFPNHTRETPSHRMCAPANMAFSASTVEAQRSLASTPMPRSCAWCSVPACQRQRQTASHVAGVQSHQSSILLRAALVAPTFRVVHGPMIWCCCFVPIVFLSCCAANVTMDGRLSFGGWRDARLGYVSRDLWASNHMEDDFG